MNFFFLNVLGLTFFGIFFDNFCVWYFRARFGFSGRKLGCTIILKGYSGGLGRIMRGYYDRKMG